MGLHSACPVTAGFLSVMPPGPTRGSRCQTAVPSSRMVCAAWGRICVSSGAEGLGGSVRPLLRTRGLPPDVSTDSEAPSRVSSSLVMGSHLRPLVSARVCALGGEPAAAARPAGRGEGPRLPGFDRSCKLRDECDEKAGRMAFVLKKKRAFGCLVLFSAKGPVCLWSLALLGVNGPVWEPLSCL